MNTFEKYKDRKIEFVETCQIDGWAIKVYTITMKERFESFDTLDAVMENLDSFLLDQPRKSNLPQHEHAFVVVHEAREGVWILFSWWTGGEMIETVVHFASYKTPAQIERSPHANSLICTWELEVFMHERAAWIEHVLQKAPAPDFISYQNDVLDEI